MRAFLVWFGDDAGKGVKDGERGERVDFHLFGSCAWGRVGVGMMYEWFLFVFSFFMGVGYI